MKHIRLHMIGTAFTAIALISSPARSETLFIPWVGANTGSGPNISSRVETGASVGVTAGGVVGADFDFGYAPDFFGSTFDSSVTTTMANMTVGIPFDETHAAGVRPYVTGGVGLIRTRISAPDRALSFANNDFGVAFLSHNRKRAWSWRRNS
jgi:hypothetical protein